MLLIKQKELSCIINTFIYFKKLSSIKKYFVRVYLKKCKHNLNL